ncbi:MAG: hypothetical protein WD649_03050 [Thermoleophilaceae bacterium]
MIAYSPRNRIRLIVTTARRHSVHGVRRGSSTRRLRRRVRGLRRVRGGLRVGTRGATKRLVFRIRRGRVRYIAVADRGLTKRPGQLGRYLHLAL